ncbi:hypothetical protein LXM60_09805 [Pandoraea sputorum]|uniref:hypothetical protein n=1 Tax=Pandoraea sputorum TaxID=93222 RepID=UPI001E5A7420|nr:hypothetical protein [Pandoraea sputorum]MCE4060494.1 hypothetical protein [Pandoraea sputorum]
MIQPTSTPSSAPLAKAQEPSSAAPDQTELAADLASVTQREGIYMGNEGEIDWGIQGRSAGQSAGAGAANATGADDYEPPFIITNPSIRPMNPAEAQSAPTLRTTTDSKSSLSQGGLHFDNPDFMEQRLTQSLKISQGAKAPVPVGGFELKYPELAKDLCPDSAGHGLEEFPEDTNQTE